jgi:hypothetical protein
MWVRLLEKLKLGLFHAHIANRIEYFFQSDVTFIVTGNRVRKTLIFIILSHSVDQLYFECKCDGKPHKQVLLVPIPVTL